MENGHLFSLAVKEVERELTIRETLQAPEDVMRRYMAERIVRRVFDVLQGKPTDNFG